MLVYGLDEQMVGLGLSVEVALPVLDGLDLLHAMGCLVDGRSCYFSYMLALRVQVILMWDMPSRMKGSDDCWNPTRS